MGAERERQHRLDVLEKSEHKGARTFLQATFDRAVMLPSYDAVIVGAAHALGYRGPIMATLHDRSVPRDVRRTHAVSSNVDLGGGVL